MTFTEKVLAVVSKIQKGQTMTYKQVAKLAGNEKASRVVGTIMKNNKDYKRIPCHRVIRTDGKMGGYNNGGIEVKREMLKQEGALK